MLAFGVAAVSSANAQDVGGHVVAFDLSVPACEGSETGQEYVGCVGGALAQADSVLNDVYERALRVANARGLREAQRAWAAYRDADCEGGLNEGALGAGHWRTGHVAICALRKTELRTAELRFRFLRE